MTRACGGVHLQYVVLAPHIEVPDHAHGELSIFAVLRGSFSTDSNCGRSDWNRFSVGIDPMDRVKGITIGPQGMGILMVHFATSCMQDLGIPSRKYAEVMKTRDSENLAGCLRLLAAEHENDLRDAGLEVLSRFESPESELVSDPAWLRQAYSMIRAEYQKPIGLASISQAVGIDPTHLARTFRKRFGCDISRFVRLLRSADAITMMIEGGMNAGAAAVEAGFADHAHFSRVYKQITGSNPRSLKGRGNEISGSPECISTH